MTRSLDLCSLAVLSAACLSSACISASPRAAPVAPQPAMVVRTDGAAIARARADSVRHPYTLADIHFMSAMIGHHSQALVIAGWASGHRANPSVQRLAERIVNGQQDEIVIMQQWLIDRNQPVPGRTHAGMSMTMDGVAHDMHMPGMLTEAQLKQLDRARGPTFDRLFLTFMIQHHRGAVSMVEKLFGSYGAAQNETVFKFASDVNVDQSTEIARMQAMLDALPPSGNQQ